MDIQSFDFPEHDITVFETSVARVFIPRAPHTHAKFGGHLVIQTKKSHSDCTEFTAEEGLVVWTMAQACTRLMLDHLDAERTNIQDNGNWFYLKPPDEQATSRPRCHLHVYGRSSKENEYNGPGAQMWGKSLDFPLPDQSGPEEGTVWMNYIYPYTTEQIALIKAKLPEYYNQFLLQE